MKKIKIALYTQSYPPKGGGIATSHYNIYHLLKNDYDVRIFVFNENINYEDVIMIKKMPSKLLFRILKVVLGKYLKKYHVHSEFTQTFAIIKVLLVIRKLNRKLRIFSPDFIIIPDHDVPAYGLKKPAGAKLIWFARHNYTRFRDNPLFSGNNWIDADVAHSMERKAVKKADAVISPSRYMIEIFTKTLRNDIPSFIIPNFIEQHVLDSIKPVSLLSFLKIDLDIPVIYIPSAGSIFKGKRYTFEIIRRISRALNDQVVFYLSDIIPSDLKMELNSLTNSHIYAPGYIEWSKNYAFVKTCHLGISANLVENFSNAILEAQTIGLPFVAFNTGGNSEIIENNETGFIVPYLDVESLLEKSLKVLNDPQLHKQLSEKAKTRCNDLFHKDKISGQYHNVFLELTTK